MKLENQRIYMKDKMIELLEENRISIKNKLNKLHTERKEVSNLYLSKEQKHEKRVLITKQIEETKEQYLQIKRDITKSKISNLEKYKLGVLMNFILDNSNLFKEFIDDKSLLENEDIIIDKSILKKRLKLGIDSRDTYNNFIELNLSLFLEYSKPTPYYSYSQTVKDKKMYKEFFTKKFEKEGGYLMKYAWGRFVYQILKNDFVKF